MMYVNIEFVNIYNLILINIYHMVRIGLVLMFVVILCNVRGLQYNQTQKSLKTDLQIEGMTYSYDQIYLGCRTNDSVLIFNGVTLDLIQTLNQPRVSYLTFNFKSQLLAMAFPNKSISIFKKNPNRDLQFLTIPIQTIQADPDYPILDIKFSKNSNYLAVAQNSNISIYNIIPKSQYTPLIQNPDILPEDQIYFQWLNQDPPAFLILFEQKITSIAWELNTENILVGGAETKFTLFGPKNGYNDVLLNFQSGTETYIDMCQNGLLVAVSNRTLRMFKTDGSKLFEKQISYNMLQVYCSANSKYLMAVTNDPNIFTIWYQQDENFWFDQLVGFNGISLVLSPSGSDSIWLVFKKSGLEYSLCIKNGQFYNSNTDACQSCKSQCSECHETSQTCFSCNKKFYLVNNHCTRCLPGCSSCRFGNVCDQCIDGPHIKNGTICQCNGGGVFIADQCYCKNGFYYDIQTCTSCLEGCLTCETKQKCVDCQEGYEHHTEDQICHKIQNGGGLSTVGLVFIIIGCLVAVTLIVIAVIFIRRRRQMKQQTALLIKSGQDIRDDY